MSIIMYDHAINLFFKIVLVDRVDETSAYAISITKHILGKELTIDVIFIIHLHVYGGQKEKFLKLQEFLVFCGRQKALLLLSWWRKCDKYGNNALCT